MDAQDWPGVVRAAGDLAADIARVTGVAATVSNDGNISGANVVIVGTLGKSKLIDRLVRERKISVSEISNRWESFFIQTVPDPFAGSDDHTLQSVKWALVICGSDKRGTIYGIYDLSEQIGVSPWYYWADVPATQHDALFVKAGKFVQGPPAVK